MMGRMASRGLTSLALLCASLAWFGYVFLHTVGDPTRAEDIATAVLEDDASREQIASSLALQIVRASGIDRSNIDLVEGAVTEALADPRITTQLISAFGSAHSNALGVDDPRSTTIDTDDLLAAVRDRVGVITPELAAQLPQGVLPEVSLPTFHPPGVGTARTVADAATGALALAAGVLIVLAFVLGDRRRVLRRAGIWAILAGVMWALVPIGIVAGARAWASDADAVVEAAVRTSVDGVAPVAVGLLIAGVVAVVLSLVPALWPERNDAQHRGSDVQRRGSVVQSAAGQRAGSATQMNTAAHPAAGRQTTQAPATARQPAAPPPAHGDSWASTGSVQSPQAVAQHRPTPPPVFAPQHGPTDAPAAPTPAPAAAAASADDVDPWATYFGPSSTS